MVSRVRPTIVAGNWKHHPTREEGEALFQAVLGGYSELPSPGQVWLIPPAPYVGLFGEGFRTRTVPAGVGLGVQDLSVQSFGAHTGEVGGELFASFGASLALCGHSERRQSGESDAEVAEKALAADRAGLVPLLCVGESEEERDRGETLAVVERQIGAVTGRFSPDRPLWIAYEPVWAIGTGRTATPEQVVEVHRSIRDSLIQRGRDGAQTPILYGGSVKPNNAASLLAEVEIDGALVGGASLDAESFLAIVAAAPAGGA